MRLRQRTSTVASVVPLRARAVTKRLGRAAVSATRSATSRYQDFFERVSVRNIRPSEIPTLQDILAGPNHPKLDMSAFEGLVGQELRDALRDAQDNGRIVPYRAMRSLAFAGGLAGPDGLIRDVYSSRKLPTGKIPNERSYNWEHLVPQSWNNLRGTLYRWHMFNGLVSNSSNNSKRGHLPFGEVVPGTEIWAQDGCKLGKDSRGRQVFEPPKDMRGPIAHRVLWIFTEASELFPAEYEFEVATLVRWAVDAPLVTPEELDPVLQAEKIEGESLYYAHEDGDFLLRAFVDILEKYQDESNENARVYGEAVAVADAEEKRAAAVRKAA